MKFYRISKIEYILPFENKGKEIGVTLEHPHGQIYSFGHIPEIIKKQSKDFQKNPEIPSLLSPLGGPDYIIFFESLVEHSRGEVETLCVM